MYSVDSRDQVVELRGLPRSDPGAPLPLVLADDHCLVLAYLINTPNPAWDGTWVNIKDPTSGGGSIALVEFPSYSALLWGPPNDEAFRGHPLADRGLHTYGAFEVRGSSWVRTLERMNRVHSGHRPERYAGLRHFIFTFHESVFECVAEKYRVTTHAGSLAGMLPEMQRRLGHDATRSDE
jgi:hypothetical protein